VTGRILDFIITDEVPQFRSGRLFVGNGVEVRVRLLFGWGHEILLGLLHLHRELIVVAARWLFFYVDGRLHFTAPDTDKTFRLENVTGLLKVLTQLWRFHMNLSNHHARSGRLIVHS
jgi:hypothetical protein